MTAEYDLIATTAFGLEAIVKRELADLGYAGSVVAPGWICFRGDATAICRTNIWLRTADRVLLRIGTFPARDFETLFETTRALDWAHWIGADDAFPVAGRSIKSQLSSVPACQRAVKKAIVDSLMAAHHTNTLAETGPQYRVEIALLRDQATLTIDTTGPSLHKRGYRPQVSQAPLKETLAAAMVMLSFWHPDRPLLDPFCGSGTIAIEAALIGQNRAPGLHRFFAAESWSQPQRALWTAARTAARDAIAIGDHERIVATDIDPNVLRLARANAERAEVADCIHFQQRDFAHLTSKRQHGCLITNPPYGQRMGADEDLTELYGSMPMVLRNLPTWSHFILTAFADFETLIGKTADRRRKLYNGRIECTYYQFHGPHPSQRSMALHADEPSTEPGDQPASDTAEPAQRKLVTTPVFGGRSAKTDEQAELLRRRLVKRAHHLRRWPARKGITCYRLYERDIPEIPLVVDRYEDCLHIAEYDRPHDRDSAQHADWLDLMAHTAAQTLTVDRRDVFLKRRQPQHGTSQYERLSNDSSERIVREGGLRFVVNLSDFIDTGLFLDHRITRQMVREAAAGRHVLNLFGYTGAFTVYAAAGEANSTTTVDTSRTYLDWARRNLDLNGISGGKHELIRADAREFLSGLPRQVRYDLAIVDPPTFSNSKGGHPDWAIQDDYVPLLEQVLHSVRPGGIVFFSTNFRRFKFDATAIRAGEIREISRQTVPPDFRNRRIHRCWRIAK